MLRSNQLSYHALFCDCKDKLCPQKAQPFKLDFFTMVQKQYSNVRPTPQHTAGSNH